MVEQDKANAAFSSQEAMGASCSGSQVASLPHGGKSPKLHPLQLGSQQSRAVVPTIIAGDPC